MRIKISALAVVIFILIIFFAVETAIEFRTVKDFNKSVYSQRDALSALQEVKNSQKNKVLGTLSDTESENHLSLPKETASLPRKNPDFSEAEVKAKAAAVFDVGSGELLFQKDIKNKLPIASLTKLMTALVVLDNADLEESVTVSKRAVETEGARGSLSPGEKISVRNLLYTLLVESSNDAAVALAEYIGSQIILNQELFGNQQIETPTLPIEKESEPEFKNIEPVDKFVELMNRKARYFKLKDTYFFNPSGLDGSGKGENYSTAYDLVELTNFALQEPLIWEISRTQKIEVKSIDGKISHLLENTNELLGKFPNIVGGKTGYTEESGQSLILIVGDPVDNHQIISVVLNAEDRFAETEKLVNWVFENYFWE